MDALTLAGVFLAAMLGGGVRWALTQCARWGQRPLLWGTAVANTVACGVVGAAGTGAPLWLVAGFAGALSTWSTLAGELEQLRRYRGWAAALSYLGVTVTCGALAWLGGSYWG